MYACDPRRIARCAPALAIVIASACSNGEKSATAGADSAAATAAAPAAACADTSAGLTLPNGFCATVFADSVAHGRHVVVASNGDVYVTVEGTAPAPEKQMSGADKGSAPYSFAALRDTNHDGKADIMKRVGSLGNTGIGLSNGYLYVDEGKRIVRYARPDSQLVPTAKAEVVVDGIPLGPGHRSRDFVIGSDGALYVNVGSATNSCQKKDRENESPGVDPCTELTTRAGIWRFAANKVNQHFTPSARYATGIRNAMGIAFGPDGKLQVNQGDDFGWPYCYYAQDEKKLVDAPEYGGDGKKTDRCANRKEPVAVYPGHWAPMSLMFYNGSNFPARYRNGAFIAFHGSWNRAPEPQEGYRVVFQPMNGSSSGGDFETFANGFAGVTGQQLQPGTAKHRPVGLATGPDGALSYGAG